MQTINPAPPTGDLPRQVLDDLLWTGGCIEQTFHGKTVREHYNVYLIRGKEKTFLVDTGMPSHRPIIEPVIEDFLAGRQLDYVFPTHAEFPHAGLLDYWLKKYPNARAVGDLRDYHLFYPHLTDRFIQKNVGESVDLGDRKITFIPAVWRDLNSTLWAYDDRDKVLFVSDGFSYLHFDKCQCDLLTSEQPLPDVSSMKFYNEQIFQWALHSDVSPPIVEFDAIMNALKPRYLAPAHSGFIDTKEDLVPLAKAGLALGS